MYVYGPCILGDRGGDERDVLDALGGTNVTPESENQLPIYGQSNTPRYIEEMSQYLESMRCQKA